MLARGRGGARGPGLLLVGFAIGVIVRGDSVIVSGIFWEHVYMGIVAFTRGPVIIGQYLNLYSVYIHTTYTLRNAYGAHTE